MSYIISLANQKGGVGKTTSAVEIAACLAALDKRVILIDFDQQHNASDSLGADLENTIYDVFEQNCGLDEAIVSVSGFDLIPGDEQLSNLVIDFSLNKDSDNIYLLADVCEALKEDYDYILIDTHPDRNLNLNMALVASDYVIAPSSEDKFSISGVENLEKDLETLRGTRSRLSHARLIAIILTRFRDFNVDKVTLMQLEDIASGVKGDVFVETVRIASRAQENTYVEGQTLQEYDRHGNASVDYRRITKKLVAAVEGKKRK